MGSHWRMREADERTVLAIAQRAGVPDVVARILAGRGVSPEQAESHMQPTLRELLPDPFHLKDMLKAAERIAQEVVRCSLFVVREDKGHANNEQRTTNNSPIAIFGDYDVDGATSSALLVRYFRALGIEPLVHIPDRMKEGYGPNSAALLALKEKGARLVITVDCGTMAFEPLKAAKEAGLDVIVVDHHKSEPHFPECYALVNPNRFDETSEHGNMAAVGVAFLLCVAVNSLLRKEVSGVRCQVSDKNTLKPETRNLKPDPLPDLMQLLDLVALGTVCDVVPLTGANRALVAQGLKKMAQRGNPGIAALMDVARLNESPGCYHAGFIIGPRINAGGRVGEADLGVRILTCDDALEAATLAQRLDLHNQERKAIETLVQEEAMLQAEAQAENPVIIVASGGWHAGVIGIVAGRLKEQFHKPAIVISIAGGTGKASARSISGIDIGNAVLAACQAGVLLSGGGHAMAAGFSVAEGAIPAAAEFLNHWVKQRTDETPVARTLYLDGALSPGGLTAELARAIERAGPFGAGNPSPRFMLQNVRLVRFDVVGENHLRLLLSDAHGKSKAVKAMAFRAAGNEIGQAVTNLRGRSLHVAGQVKLNSWQGVESAEFIVDDLAFAG